MTNETLKKTIWNCSCKYEWLMLSCATKPQNFAPVAQFQPPYLTYEFRFIPQTPSSISLMSISQLTPRQFLNFSILLCQFLLYFVDVGPRVAREVRLEGVEPSVPARLPRVDACAFAVSPIDLRTLNSAILSMSSTSPAVWMGSVSEWLKCVYQCTEALFSI